MSGRGRKALPANVHMLRGNPSKKPLAELTGSFQPEVDIPNCPRHLLPEARKEWKRMSAQLERYGLISQLDRSMFALYCQAWARCVWAEEALAREHRLALERMAEAEAAGQAYAGGDGYTVQTPNGHMTYSPYWVMSNKAQEQLNRYLARFGLDPSSRGQVNLSAVRQRDMFDNEDEGPKGGFNDL